MLYATTRSKADSFTEHRTLFENRASNGGFFVPFRMPQVDQSQIADLKKRSFGENVSFVLNLFFPGSITSWDVDCSIGKNPAEVFSIKQRIMLAKLCDNPQGEYGYISDRLFAKLCSDKTNTVTEWANIAIRISVLFGIYGIMQDLQSESFDICVNCGDFSDPMAAWYARDMGLPIGRILCICDDDSPIWDFLHKGELDTGANAFQTHMSSKCSSAPVGIERLIFATLGYEQTQKYLQISSQERVYHLLHEQLKLLNNGMFACVVGKEREHSVKAAFRGNYNHRIDTSTASAYAGLQDYRAKTGESNHTLLLWDQAND